MVEVVVVPFVDRHAQPAGPHEAVEVLVLEEQRDAARRLVGVVAPDHAGAGDGVIGLADSGEQHQAHVVEHVRGEQHQLGRLLELAPARIHIGHAHRALLRRVEVDPGHVGERAQLEVLVLHQHRHDRGLRARLRRHLAGKALAVAAVDAGVQLRAVLVPVVARRRRYRRRERLPAERRRGLGEERRGVRHLHRRVGILPRARALERVAAGDDLAFQVSRLAAHAVEALELVEVRLELLVGHAPVLAGPVLGHVALAVARDRLAARLEVPGREAPGLGAPVHCGAAYALARLERAEVAHRQRGLVFVVAEGNGLAREVLHQRMPALVFQLVMRVRHREVGEGVAHLAALDADHLEAGLGELLREDGAGHADADQHHVDRFELARHGQSFLVSSTCFGWPCSSTSAMFCCMSAIETGSAS